MHRCKELEGKACEYVLCKDNPHFYCKLDKKYKCRCPSCKDVDYWEKGMKHSCNESSMYTSTSNTRTLQED